MPKPTKSGKAEPEPSKPPKCSPSSALECAVALGRHQFAVFSLSDPLDDSNFGAEPFGDLIELMNLAFMIGPGSGDRHGADHV